MTRVHLYRGYGRASVHIVPVPADLVTDGVGTWFAQPQALTGSQQNCTDADDSTCVWAGAQYLGIGEFIQPLVQWYYYHKVRRDKPQRHVSLRASSTEHPSLCRVNHVGFARELSFDSIVWTRLCLASLCTSKRVCWSAIRPRPWGTSAQRRQLLRVPATLSSAAVRLCEEDPACQYKTLIKDTD